MFNLSEQFLTSFGHDRAPHSQTQMTHNVWYILTLLKIHDAWNKSIRFHIFESLLTVHMLRGNSGDKQQQPHQIAAGFLGQHSKTPHKREQLRIKRRHSAYVLSSVANSYFYLRLHSLSLCLWWRHSVAQLKMPDSQEVRQVNANEQRRMTNHISLLRLFV